MNNTHTGGIAEMMSVYNVSTVHINEPGLFVVVNSRFAYSPSVSISKMC